MSPLLQGFEAFTGFLTLAAAVTGFPPSFTIKFAMNSQIINFHCFNNEEEKLSFFQHPVQVPVLGSIKVMTMFVGVAIITGVFGIFGIILCVLSRSTSIQKASAKVLFPSLPIVLIVVVLPLTVCAGWQAAIKVSTAEAAVLALATTAVVFTPLIHLLQVLYDDQHFPARFEYYSEVEVESYRRFHPFAQSILIPGQWYSVDRFSSYHHRYFFCLIEYTVRRKYWFAVELLETIAVGVLMALPNQNQFMCGSQLAVVLLVRVASLAAILAVKPYITLFGQYSMLFVNIGHIMLLAFKFWDVFQGETRFIEFVMKNAAMFSLFFFTCVAGCFIVVNILRFKARYEMGNVASKLSGAVPRVEPLLSEPTTFDPHQYGRVEDKDGLLFYDGEPVGRSESMSYATREYQLMEELNFPAQSRRTSLSSAQEEEHEFWEEGNDEYQMETYEFPARAPQAAMPTASAQSTNGALNHPSPHAAASRKEIPKQRHLWHLLMMEEIGDPSFTQVEYNPEEDDDLL